MGNALGNAGYVVTGSGGGGGGGGGGKYVFADLDDLGDMIAEWTDLRDGIQFDGEQLAQAKYMIDAPAMDDMSRSQPAAVTRSLGVALAHNDAMQTYADSYVTELTAAMKRYADDDESHAARLRAI
jgi:hypothetical protein